MGGIGEDIAASEPETNYTKRDCVSCLSHLQSFWIHRAICHEGHVAVANTQFAAQRVWAGMTHKRKMTTVGYK